MSTAPKKPDGTKPAIKRVVTGITLQNILSRLTREVVVSSTADEQIVTCTAK